MGVPFGDVGMEWAVRPFAQRDAVLQRYIDRRPPEADGELANIRWGGKSSFGFKKGEFQVGPTVTVIYPEPDPEEPDDTPPEVPVLDYEEVARETSDHRVENPDDDEQYVIVRRAESSLLKGPDIRPDSQIGREGRQAFIYIRVKWKNDEDDG